MSLHFQILLWLSILFIIAGTILLVTMLKTKKEERKESYLGFTVIFLIFGFAILIYTFIFGIFIICRNRITFNEKALYIYYASQRDKQCILLRCF